MDAAVARVLLVADTHLGFDLPFRPRIERRRRGPDFFRQFEQALEPALHGEVDLVVHGGDLLYRSKVPAALVEMAVAPLLDVARTGVPVYVVPGNHERSRIPLNLWSSHANLHVFDRPRTFLCPVAGGTIALAGFPYARRIGGAFRDLVRQTGHSDVTADARLLCVHQVVEGAQVGVQEYTFRRGPHVVRGREIPDGFCAVLSGHIHRAQTLTHDLGGTPLAAPVIYPGSVGRTSFAERNEEKGYVILSVGLSGRGGGQLAEISFKALPTRPMVQLVLELEGLDEESLVEELRRRLSSLHPDSVVRVQLRGPETGKALALLSAGRLRELAPPSMNVSLAPDRRLARDETGPERRSRKEG